MGTEVALSFSALRAQLENEKSSLYKIDENIKKIVQTSGRFSNDRSNSSGSYPRGGQRPGGRNSFPDTGKSDDLFGKRKHETKTVFSRVSGRANDSDGEEEGGREGDVAAKRMRVPSAVTRQLPSRAAVLRAQGGAGDETQRTRNKRMFGSLLGTLHKFKQEEIVLQGQEDKKAQVERKIEEQARLQKEKEQKERKMLFTERDQKKAMIKALEAKMNRVQEFEKWVASQRHLGNFILTKAKPHIYWLPRRMNDKAAEKLNSSRKFHEKCMSAKRELLQEELQRIEQRCLRRPGAKENDPETPGKNVDRQDKPGNEEEPAHEKNDEVNEASDDTDKGRKRDKFAMDADEKEESDCEDRHEDVPVANGEEKQDNSMEAAVENQTDTSVEPLEPNGNTAELLEPNDNTAEETKEVEAEPTKDTSPEPAESTEHENITETENQNTTESEQNPEHS